MVIESFSEEDTLKAGETIGKMQSRDRFIHCQVIWVLERPFLLKVLQKGLALRSR